MILIVCRKVLGGCRVWWWVKVWSGAWLRSFWFFVLFLSFVVACILIVYVNFNSFLDETFSVLICVFDF